MKQPNDDYINKLIEMVNTSPYPKHLRMQLVSISVDQAVVKLNTEQCHLQPFGIVHGGVLATLIDTATFWSVFLRAMLMSAFFSVCLDIILLISALNNVSPLIIKTSSDPILLSARSTAPPVPIGISSSEYLIFIFL